MIKASDIHVKTGKVEGFGAPGYHWVLVHYGNVSLEYSQHYSEREAGKAEALYEQRWKQHDWYEAEWTNAIEGKPPASTPCSHCGLDTIDGTSSQYDRQWCTRPACRTEQKAYAQTKHIEHEQSMAQIAADNERERQQWKDMAKEAQSGFHWRDGRFFKRMPDGSVRLSHVHGESLQSQFNIPAPEWASIVCSVSEQGETGERWEESQDFHGRSPAQRSGDDNGN